VGGKSPNDLYVGVELVPSPDRTFTYVQYFALASLLIEIRERRGVELSGRKLVGHEDLHPLARWNISGGWDPGALRAQPLFSWQKLRGLIDQGTNGAKA
jgi:N-acetyl-anhydromuramyl-L-alanine amidase AmpD